MAEREVDWPTVTMFAEAMKDGLDVNEHKGGWEDCSEEFLIAKLAEEFAEFVQAVKGEESAEAIREEAADLANVAMMLADNCGAFDVGEE